MCGRDGATCFPACKDTGVAVSAQLDRLGAPELHTGYVNISHGKSLGPG